MTPVYTLGFATSALVVVGLCKLPDAFLNPFVANYTKICFSMERGKLST